MASQAIYHITSAAEVRQAGHTGEYAPSAFETEGFIHCSHPRQLIKVANARFRGRTDLMLLEIDPTRLACPVIEENLEGGAEMFPHIYGRLPMSAVIRIHEFPCTSTGSFELPDSVDAA